MSIRIFFYNAKAYVLTIHDTKSDSGIVEKPGIAYIKENLTKQKAEMEAMVDLLQNYDIPMGQLWFSGLTAV